MPGLSCGRRGNMRQFPSRHPIVSDWGDHPRNANAFPYRSLIENSSDMIFLLTAGGEIEYASPACQRILGYAREQIVGRHWLEMVHPSDLAATSQQMAALLQEAGAKSIQEYRFCASDGSWHWLGITAVNALDDAAVGSVIINAHDVTDRKRAEMERGVILEVMDTLHMDEKLSDVLTRIQKSLRKALYADNCSVALQDSQRGTFVFPFFTDQFEESPPARD